MFYNYSKSIDTFYQRIREVESACSKGKPELTNVM